MVGGLHIIALSVRWVGKDDSVFAQAAACTCACASLQAAACVSSAAWSPAPEFLMERIREIVARNVATDEDRLHGQFRALAPVRVVFAH